VLLLYKGMELAGYKVNYDPNSPDFLKMRKGNDVWDVSAGLAPRLRDLLRLAMLFKPGNDARKTVGDISGGALVRMLSPAVRLPAEQGYLAAARAQGFPDAKSPFTGFKPDERQGLILAFPLIYQSMFQAFNEEEGTTAQKIGSGAFAGAREFVGFNVNRYPEKTLGRQRTRSRHR
jgi:hypothetical protein